MDRHNNEDDDYIYEYNEEHEDSEIQKDLDSAITQKNSKVNPIIREQRKEIKRNDPDISNEFLHRLSFDRSEYIQRYAQTEKTDDELIRETLEHFKMKQISEQKRSIRAEKYSFAPARSKEKQSLRKYSSKESLKRNSAAKRDLILKREFSVEELLRSIDAKKEKQRPTNKVSTADSIININYASKDNIASLDDIPITNHSRELFINETRGSTNVKDKKPYKSFKGIAKDVKSSKKQKKANKRIPFRTNEDLALHDQNTTNSSIEIAECQIEDIIENEKCIKMSIYDSNDKNIFIYDNSSSKQREGTDDKAIQIANFKYEDNKKHSSNKKDSIKIKNHRQIPHSTKNQSSSANYFKSCDNHNTRIDKCKCVQLQSLAKELNMDFNDEFISFIKKAALGKLNTRPNGRNENRNKDNSNMANSAFVLYRKANKHRDVYKEKNKIMSHKKASYNRNLNIKGDIAYNMKSDRVKAFKRMFLKTENGQYEGRDAVNRKQSREMDEFR